MIRRHATGLRILLAIVDTSAAVAVLLFAASYRFGGRDVVDPFLVAIPYPGLALAIYAIGWPVALWSQGLYRTRVRLALRSELVDVLRATAFFAAAILSVLFLAKLVDVSRTVLAIVFPGLAVSAFATRRLIGWSLEQLRARGRNTRFVLVIGANARAQAFADLIEAQTALGLRVVGHLAIGDERASVGRPILGTLEQLEEVLHGEVVDEVAVCLPVSQWGRIDEIARLCEEEGKIVRIPMYVLERTLATGRVEEVAGLPIYSMVVGPDRVLGLIAKRALDLVGSAILIILLAPAVALIGVAIRLDTGGPIFFRQWRTGLHGRAFEVVKFRSMVPGAEAALDELRVRNEIDGHAFKLTDDPRVTRVGRWLRRTSLDELPQLWNVLRGEMSLVGPRPPLPSEVASYDIWHRRRLSMKPGMTGLWQVRARRDGRFDRWVEVDLEYIDRWSLWLDLRILLQTIPAVLGGQGR